MRALRVGDKPDPLSGGVQAHAKIDIFNLGCLIKPTKSPERICPHHAQAGPERRRLAITVLMDPVMAQIGIEPGQAPRPRSVIIAAERGRNLWFGLKGRHESAESLALDDYIRVDEGEDISAGLSRR